MDGNLHLSEKDYQVALLDKGIGFQKYSNVNHLNIGLSFIFFGSVWFISWNMESVNLSHYTREGFQRQIIQLTLKWMPECPNDGVFKNENDRSSFSCVPRDTQKWAMSWPWKSSSLVVIAFACVVNIIIIFFKRCVGWPINFADGRVHNQKVLWRLQKRPHAFEVRQKAPTFEVR